MLLLWAIDSLGGSGFAWLRCNRRRFPTKLNQVNTYDPTTAAFAEYASKEWDSDQWRAFGRDSGTGDILTSHPRLYRSLGFGDDDYPDAVQGVLPQVLQEASGPTLIERMAFVAEFVPSLPEWVSEHGSYRTKKRFRDQLTQNPRSIPKEWHESAHLLTTKPDATPPRPPVVTAGDSLPTVGNGRVRWLDPQVTRTTPRETTSSGDTSREVSAALPSSTGDTPPDNPALASPTGSQKPQAKDLSMPDSTVLPESIFIVHGRDTDAVNVVKLFVYDVTGIMPQILADRAGGGDTIIEKFEREAASSDYAIVLLTPDDEGHNKADGGDLQDRARQNVILELGYFFGKLGRSKVAVLNGGVEQPSDVHGLNYISYPSGQWKEELRRELRTAGFTIIG